MKRVLLIALLLLVLLASSMLAFAQASEFSLPWYTIDGGAASSQAGGFGLSGTIGQPDAGALSGGDFTLVGGFGGSVPNLTNQQLYLPIIRR
jgi:hypothetical protein